jgi:hypothetical protein
MATRTRNLTDQDIRTIVEILDGWTGALSWNALIEAIAQRLYGIYTRQALHKHERIRQAFVARKKSLASARARSRREGVSLELQIALERIDRLEAQKERLEAENNHLLEQFVRWAYNAHTRNLEEEFLSRPLPGVDRDRTRTTT